MVITPRRKRKDNPGCSLMLAVCIVGVVAVCLS